MLEVVASQDLWIWHAFFGLSGANNDLNVLYRSNLFDGVLDDVALESPFTVNGKKSRVAHDSCPLSMVTLALLQ
ncbi:ALP1-like protein [Tanacetum coccineum]